ncbi:hypothetical protein G9A89_009905 [Geosiphon pyriformis]|nr:hypothetical protein G9A89_009905 [Geosiphon pyriformis]
MELKLSGNQYIENRINNYLFGNYNISEVRSNLYNNLVYYSQLGTEDLNKLNFNIIEYCKEKYPVQSQYSIDFESETETSNKDKQKSKQYSRTTLNTPILPKTIAKHLQTPEQGTSLTTYSVFKNRKFLVTQKPYSTTKHLQTSTNLLDFLIENRSEHSKTAIHDENNSELSEEKEESIHSESEEDEMTAYIAKIPKFNGENIETITKAGDVNRWNATRMLRTISYFLKRTAGEWFKNLAAQFND